MKLSETKLRQRYFHAGRRQIVELITCDPIDGASLIVEPFDDFGDIMGGDLFRCEACKLQPLTREIYEMIYPPSDPDNHPFDDDYQGREPEALDTQQKLRRIEVLLETLGDDEAIRRMEFVAPVRGDSVANWIAVEDELPDDEISVLVCDSSGDVEMGFLDEGEWRNADASRIHATILGWCEVPEGMVGEVPSMK